MSFNRDNGKYSKQYCCEFCGNKLKDETFQHSPQQYANLKNARIIRTERITPVCAECGDVEIEENADKFDVNKFWYSFFENFRGKAKVSLKWSDDVITLNSGRITVNGSRFNYELGDYSLYFYIEKSGITFSKTYSFNDMRWEMKDSEEL